MRIHEASTFRRLKYYLVSHFNKDPAERLGQIQTFVKENFKTKNLILVRTHRYAVSDGELVFDKFYLQPKHLSKQI